MKLYRMIDACFKRRWACRILEEIYFSMKYAIPDIHPTEWIQYQRIHFERCRFFLILNTVE
jgi:hypothetical protein